MPSCPFACVEELGALRVLDLSHNEVQAVEAKVFTFLTSLVKLNLAHNRINQISPDVFLQERGSSPIRGKPTITRKIRMIIKQEKKNDNSAHL
jgi:hypothetical protein